MKNHKVQIMSMILDIIVTFFQKVLHLQSLPLLLPTDGI